MSVLFQQRLALVTPDRRAIVVRALRKMTESWSEEVDVKTDYWQQLPYLLHGIWPNDGGSQNICKQIQEEVARIKEKNGGELKGLDRVSFKFVDPRHPSGYAAMIERCANTGELPPELEIASQERNLAATQELRIEEVQGVA